MFEALQIVWEGEREFYIPFLRFFFSFSILLYYVHLILDTCIEVFEAFVATDVNENRGMV